MADWLGSRSNTRLHHAVGLATLVLVILTRWWIYITADVALGDEFIYLQAFRAVANGADPGQVGGFYYPPTFAALGGWLVQTVGELGTQAILRISSVLGLVITVWISACLWQAPWSWRVAVSSLFVLVSPAVAYGFAAGNISFVVTGTILLALAAWSYYPITSGVLLGTSTAIKPLAPLAILALVSHRPVPESRQQILAGCLGGTLALAFLSSDLGYLTTKSAAVGRLPFIRSISLNRILVLLGIELSPVLIAAILGLLVALTARLWPMNRRTMLCFGGVAAVLAVPIIWSHTLLLTLPLQVLALSLAMTRKREHPTLHPAQRKYEWIFVVLAVAALQLTEGAGAIDDRALAFQLVILTGAYLAAPALMAYVLAVEQKTRRL